MTKTNTQTYSQRYFQRSVDTRTVEIDRLDSRIADLDESVRKGAHHPSLFQTINRLKAERKRLQGDKAEGEKQNAINYRIKEAAVLETPHPRRQISRATHRSDRYEWLHLV